MNELVRRLRLQKLIGNASALLQLDERGVLKPHGIGGHAREIIKSFIRECEAASSIEHSAKEVGAVSDEMVEPKAWLHEIIEPDTYLNQPQRLLSFSPDNPWSHWLKEHQDKCEYRCTPLAAIEASRIPVVAEARAEPRLPKGFELGRVHNCLVCGGTGEFRCGPCPGCATPIESAPAAEVKALTYGQQLVAEAIEAHFGERVEHYDEDVDDTANHYAWATFDAAFATPSSPDVELQAEVVRLTKEVNQFQSDNVASMRMYAQEVARASSAVKALEEERAEVARLTEQLSVADAHAEKIEALLEPHVQWECATDGCGKLATYHFIRDGVGSYFCHSCYMKVQAQSQPSAIRGGEYGR